MFPRRRLIQNGLLLTGSLAFPGVAWAAATSGKLSPPDANGLRLAPGLTSRVVARTGEEPSGTSGYRWHGMPDGGGVFAAPDGGWVYVSNSEMRAGQGGVGALRFGPDGEPAAAYSILKGTSRNCSGGATPWGTWLSCEETPTGRVWECDPFGRHPAVPRPALGVFMHEGAAVDPATGQVYLTEDLAGGLLYRFTPRGADGLTAGALEAARVLPPAAPGAAPTVDWLSVPDPLARDEPTRGQVPGATPFDRGEGIVHHGGSIFFATTGDHRVWGYHIASRRLTVRYDGLRHGIGNPSPTAPPPLIGPDNLTATSNGTLLIGEDGGEMRIVALPPVGGPNALLPGGGLHTLVQVQGQRWSEVTGPALSPDGARLYFSSQRGQREGGDGGITYEVAGRI